MCKIYLKKKKTFKLQLKPPQNPGQMQRHTMSLNRKSLHHEGSFPESNKLGAFSIKLLSYLFFWSYTGCCKSSLRKLNDQEAS